MSQSDQPVVSIVRTDDCHCVEALLDPVKEACDLIGGLESLIMAGNTVMLKPNLVRSSHYMPEPKDIVRFAPMPHCRFVNLFN